MTGIARFPKENKPEVLARKDRGSSRAVTNLEGDMLPGECGRKSGVVDFVSPSPNITGGFCRVDSDGLLSSELSLDDRRKFISWLFGSSSSD